MRANIAMIKILLDEIPVDAVLKDGGFYDGKESGTFQTFEKDGVEYEILKPHGKSPEAYRIKSLP